MFGIKSKYPKNIMLWWKHLHNLKMWLSLMKTLTHLYFAVPSSAFTIMHKALMLQCLMLPVTFMCLHSIRKPQKLNEWKEREGVCSSWEHDKFMHYRSANVIICGKQQWNAMMRVTGAQFNYIILSHPLEYFSTQLDDGWKHGFIIYFAEMSEMCKKLLQQFNGNITTDTLSTILATVQWAFDGWV